MYFNVCRFSEENPKYIDPKCNFTWCWEIDLMQLLTIGFSYILSCI